MDKNKFDRWIKILTLISSAIAFGFTVCTWREQIHVHRAELLENKIKEFEDSSTLLARAIIDQYAVCGDCLNDTTNHSDKEMISIGSSRIGNKTDIYIKNLNETLNEPLPSTNINKQRVRQSFDKLLDFFGRLDYYVHINSMTENEIMYFKYYIEACANNKAIMTYAHKYSFDLFLSLVKRIN